MADAPAQVEMGDMGRRRLQNQEFTDIRGEESAAYKVLMDDEKIDTRYRLQSSDQIDANKPNATRYGNLSCQMLCCPLGIFGIPQVCLHSFEVSTGMVRKVRDGRGNFMFYGKGVHRIIDPFYKIGEACSFKQGVIIHGDRALLVVDQGSIGYVMEKGHPVLLPPGLHQWQSTTMVYETSFDLNNNVLRMGPLTLVTVDSGYSAVTEDNGNQRILDGGNMYLLTHKNWKFIKYLSSKIQSNDLKRIEATSADNVLMAVNATVIWRISDVHTAALNSAETISKDGGEKSHYDDQTAINKLKNDVLKQAEASLAAFIGAVNYSDSFNVAAVMQKGDIVPMATGGKRESSPLFDAQRMATCLEHANSVTQTYGVTILSINVVAAVPADKQLMVSLAQGAVAAAEAQKYETVASGTAAAAKIQAAGEAEAEIMRANGDSKAAKTRADGDKAAADLLKTNPLAVELQTISKAGKAVGDNKAFFFNSPSQDVSKMLAQSVARPK